eukprot:8242636-Prorocentrum_lima.AAC.1
MGAAFGGSRDGDRDPGMTEYATRPMHPGRAREARAGGVIRNVGESMIGPAAQGGTDGDVAGWI